MTEGIIIALISGLCVAIPSILTVVITSNANAKLVDYRLQQMEEKLDQYKDLPQRVFVIERDQQSIWENIDYLKGKEENKNDTGKVC
jgi:uncharacterized membrane protein